VDCLLLPRLTPPVAPVPERRTVTAQAGDVFLHSEAGEWQSLAEPDVTNKQKQLRQEGRKARTAKSAVERELASNIIAAKVISSNWFRHAEYVACYLPTPDEVNTWEIIARAWRMKKRIFVPVLEKTSRMQFQEITPESELQRNKFGLYEPQDGDLAPARMLDVVLTPIVAFDDRMHRIGMGGGYFDRRFAFLRHRANWIHPKLIGLAFACQKVEEIAPNPWDIRVFRVITEAE